MTPARRIIIDTDPGVDDVLAILLALSATPEEVEVLLLSITFGNVEVEHCVRNAVTLFHILEMELEWRKQHGLPEGFASLAKFRPLVAVGAEQPLEEELAIAAYYHGSDGLGGVHASHPHLSPDETWKAIFDSPRAGSDIADSAASPNVPTPSKLFRPSHEPAHKEILRLLGENEPDTISIVAIGPLTNLAMAAAEDVECFLRAKEVVVMGGAIELPGNMTPVAEFNVYADAVAAARVFALSSRNPSFTMPPPAPASSMASRPAHFPGYPATLSRKLNITLFPLDTTTRHCMKQDVFEQKVRPLIQQGSPLAEWVSAFVGQTFQKIKELYGGEGDMQLHDPLCIYYILTSASHADQWRLSPQSPREDIRIETSGQWTRGMCMIDRRSRSRGEQTDMQAESKDTVEAAALPGAEDLEVIPGDTQHWLAKGKGNAVSRVMDSPNQGGFGAYMLERIFG